MSPTSYQAAPPRNQDLKKRQFLNTQGADIKRVSLRCQMKLRKMGLSAVIKVSTIFTEGAGIRNASLNIGLILFDAFYRSIKEQQ